MKWLKRFFLIVLLTVIIVGAMNFYVVMSTERFIYKEGEALPEKQAVLVLGAGVRGTVLSPVLRDRVQAGLKVYQSGNVKKMLLSGDHGRKNYDEVNAMRLYVLKYGGSSNMGNRKVEPSDLFMDHAGFDTYDSMVRARDVFRAKSLIIVTQRFHIYRAVFLARALGLDAIGVAVDEDAYGFNYKLAWYGRETLSRAKAVLDIALHAKPKYLGEWLPITGDGRRTWD